MPSWRTLVKLLTAPSLCLYLAAGPALPQDTGPTGNPAPLTEIQDETSRLRQINTEIAQTAGHRSDESERLAAQLAAEELTLRSAQIRPDDLRAARVDLDGAHSRISTLEGQLAHRQTALVRLQQRIATDARSLAAAPPQNLDDLAARTAVRLLEEQAAAQHTVVDGLQQLLTANRRLSTLREQRLRLLQGRIRLDTIDRAASSAADPRVPLLESVVTQLLRETASLVTRTGSSLREGPATAVQRDQLELRLHDTATRTYLRQNDLDLLGLQTRVDGLAALRGDSSAPRRLLAAAVAELQSIDDDLQEMEWELVSERRVLDSRHALRQERGLATGPAAASAAGLDDLIGFQEQDIKALRAHIASNRFDFAQQIAAAYTRSLTERSPLPGAPGERQRIIAGLATLPSLAAQEHRTLWRDLRDRIDALTSGGRAALAGGALVLVAGILGLRWWLRRQPLNAGRRLTIPALALIPVLPWAIPAVLWSWLAESLDVPLSQSLPRLLLLGVWPAIYFLLRLTRAELLTPGLPAEQVTLRQEFCRRLRWGLVLAAVVCTVYVLTHALPVSPLVTDLLDRLAMFGLLLLAVPAFGLKRLILNLAQSPDPSALPAPRPDDADAPAYDEASRETDTSDGRHGARLLAWVCQVAALALVAAGLLGLLGYLNLAWAIATNIGWLALVAALLYLTRGALDDLVSTTARRLKGSARSDLWRHQFLAPAHRLTILLSWLGAGWGLMRLWGWSAQTPPLRTLLDWSDRALLHAGKLALTPRDLIVAGLLVVAGLWIGAWSRQVSLELAFARVRDHGLRHALATLIQYLVICCGVLLALQVIGLDLTTLMVFTASLGVGIGFGLQNIVNNFVSGILLLVERPLRVGDFVTVSGHEGEVTRIGFRSLTIRTFDKQEVFIPNGVLITADFVNWTRTDDILRTVLTVGIGYQDDPDRAIALIREILGGYTPVLRSPTPVVSLWEFGDSAVTLRVEYCIHYLGQVGRTAVRSEVNRRIWYGFQTAGISIPYPQRDLHVHLESGGSTLIPPAAAPAP